MSIPPIDELLAVARPHREKTGRPLVTLSYAQSLDGSIAARRGSPLRLSGPEAMAMTHRLRLAHDGILVGIGTVLADDPRLNVRLAEGRDPQPVVLDSRLRFPLDARLLDGSRPPWIAALLGADPQKRAQLEQRGVRLLSLPPGEDGRISLPALLGCLAELGIGTVLADDPRLNVRLAEGRDPQPVVLDNRLRFPLDARLLDGSRPPWIAALPGADPQKQAQLEGRGARVLSLPPGEDGHISLPALLGCLAELGIDSLMVEGGGRVIASFLAQGLADRLVLTVAPVIVGGLRAVDLDAALPNPPRLKAPGYERLGEDLIIWGEISPSAVISGQ